MSKIVILLLLTAILIALFAGLYFLMKEPASSKRTLRSLMVRVGFTFVLITLLLVAAYMGWIAPHAVGK